METIRPERPGDAAAVRRLHQVAFPTAAEADLVDRLRTGGKAAVALVAEDAGEIVGHIVFSPVTFDPPVAVTAFGLAPMAVLPDHWKHGVGRRLVQNGLAECHARGACLVVVIGEPDYYRRFGFELTDGSQLFYLIWLFVLSAVFTTQNLLDSREGRAIRALKGGMVMAEAMGVNTSRSRMVIFVIAALHACASGWLYAHLQRFVNPTPFGLHIGIEYLFMAVVGGAGQVWGALLGAGVITISKQWLQDILPQLFGQSGNFEVIFFGLMMVLVLQRARDGLWPILARC